jgi:hypothetical protein
MVLAMRCTLHEKMGHDDSVVLQPGIKIKPSVCAGKLCASLYIYLCVGVYVCVCMCVCESVCVCSIRKKFKVQRI